MNIRVSLTFIVVFLAGCATVGQQDQRKWESVSCGGIKKWDACMLEAAKSCPKGFDVRNQLESQISQARSLDFSCK